MQVVALGAVKLPSLVERERSSDGPANKAVKLNANRPGKWQVVGPRGSDKRPEMFGIVYSRANNCSSPG